MARIKSESWSDIPSGHKKVHPLMLNGADLVIVIALVATR